MAIPQFPQNPNARPVRTGTPARPANNKPVARPANKSVTPQTRFLQRNLFKHAKIIVYLVLKH